jgi:hypothetical protein
LLKAKPRTPLREVSLGEGPVLVNVRLMLEVRMVGDGWAMAAIAV